MDNSDGKQAQNQKQPTFFERNNVTLKGVLILFLTLILMIPAGLISNLIWERQTNRDGAIQEVSEKWARQQTVTGPMIFLPYEVTNYDDKGVISGRSVEQLTILPENLIIDGNVEPTIKHRGIFEVVLYKSEMNLRGNFKIPDLAAFVPAGSKILWEKAQILLAMPDLRGLEAQPVLDWSGVKVAFEPGYPDEAKMAISGISAPIQLTSEGKNFDFALNLKIKGSGSLYFTPVGKTNKVSLHSTWNDPKFTGSFLPDSSKITKVGFAANWSVLHMNRNYPQIFNRDLSGEMNASAFGLDFFLPVDNYSKSLRCVKYALMFIGLTFLLVFFMEMRQKNRVHPFQYALIGLALIVFYTLLVSISEHLGFNSSYLIAATMTSLLISFFASSLFSSRKAGLFTGGVLAMLYGFLFVTLQSEDYALLIGSLGLFFILAVVMYFSRRVNLYEID